MENRITPNESTHAVNGLFTPERKMASAVYILYLLSLLIGITSIVGVVVAYVFQGEASEMVKTHYRFQIRTFWVGLLLALVGVLLTFVFIGFLVLLFLLVWFVVRCVLGLKYLNEGKPVPNPASWMFGT